VSKPRVNLTRFHEVFAPNSKHLARVTSAQRLKWVFHIDIETCCECSGAFKLIPKALAALAGQALKKILDHLKNKAETTAHTLLPENRAPPIDLFD